MIMANTLNGVCSTLARTTFNSNEILPSYAGIDRVRGA